MKLSTATFLFALVCSTCLGAFTNQFTASGGHEQTGDTIIFQTNNIENSRVTNVLNDAYTNSYGTALTFEAACRFPRGWSVSDIFTAPGFRWQGGNEDFTHFQTATVFYSSHNGLWHKQSLIYQQWPYYLLGDITETHYIAISINRDYCRVYIDGYAMQQQLVGRTAQEFVPYNSQPLMAATQPGTNRFQVEMGYNPNTNRLEMLRFTATNLTSFQIRKNFERLRNSLVTNTVDASGGFGQSMVRPKTMVNLGDGTTSTNITIRSAASCALFAPQVIGPDGASGHFSGSFLVTGSTNVSFRNIHFSGAVSVTNCGPNIRFESCTFDVQPVIHNVNGLYDSRYRVPGVAFENCIFLAGVSLGTNTLGPSFVNCLFQGGDVGIYAPYARTINLLSLNNVFATQKVASVSISNGWPHDMAADGNSFYGRQAFYSTKNGALSTIVTISSNSYTANGTMPKRKTESAEIRSTVADAFILSGGVLANNPSNAINTGRHAATSPLDGTRHYKFASVVDFNGSERTGPMDSGPWQLTAPISYSLATTNRYFSAGVYSNQHLIRTLTTAAPVASNPVIIEWNQRDDYNRLVPTSSSLSVTALAHSAEMTYVSRLGVNYNPIGGLPTMASFFIQNDGVSMGSNIVTTPNYNEQRAEIQLYGTNNFRGPQVRGWAYFNASIESTDGVAIDPTKIYGNNITSVYYTTIANTERSMTFYPAGSDAYGTNWARLDVQPGTNWMVVTSYGRNLRFLNKTTGSNGWTLLTGKTNTFLRFEGDTRFATTANRTNVVIYTNGMAGGTNWGIESTLTGFSNVVAVAYWRSNNTLYVADAGGNMKVFCYTNNVQKFAFGRPYGTNSAYSDDQFYFRYSYQGNPPGDQSMMWVEDNGNWVVGNGDFYRLSKYQAGTTNHLDDVFQAPAQYNGRHVRGDPSRYIARFREYSVNYGTSNWVPSKLYEHFMQTNWFGPGYGDLLSWKATNGRTFALLYGPTNIIVEVTPTSIKYLSPTPMNAYGAAGGYIGNGPDETIGFSMVMNDGRGHSIIVRSQVTRYDRSGFPVFAQRRTVASVPTGGSFTEEAIPTDYGGAMVAGRTNGFLIGMIAGNHSLGNHLIYIDDHSNVVWTTHRAGIMDGQEFTYDINAEYPSFMTFASGPYIFQNYHGEFWGGGQASQFYMWHETGLGIFQFGTSPNGAGDNPIGYGGNSFAISAIQTNNIIHFMQNDEASMPGWWAMDVSSITLTNLSTPVGRP